jgi:hypothetical protein
VLHKQAMDAKVMEAHREEVEDSVVFCFFGPFFFLTCSITTGHSFVQDFSSECLSVHGSVLRAGPHDDCDGAAAFGRLQGTALLQRTRFVSLYARENDDW